MKWEKQFIRLSWCGARAAAPGRRDNSVPGKGTGILRKSARVLGLPSRRREQRPSESPARAEAR